MAMAGGGRVPLFFFLTFALHFTRLFSDDTLRQSVRFRRDDFLISLDQVFKLHFFSTPFSSSPNDTQKINLGITLNDQDRVWLANYSNPLDQDSSPELIIDDYGNITISYNEGNDSIVIFSSGETRKINATAILLNNGNLKILEMNAEGSIKRLLWQGFDYPNNILLSGMKLGIAKKTGDSKWRLTSWVEPNTPVLGSFILGTDSKNTTQLVMWWKGNVFWTSGVLQEDGTFPNLKSKSAQQNHIFGYSENENEAYFSYITVTNDATGILLDAEGELDGGATVMCNGDNPAFVNGCVSPKTPACRKPQARVSMVDSKKGSMLGRGYESVETKMVSSVYDCGMMCFNNCSCHAYSSITQDNTGCQMRDKGTPFQEDSAGRQIYFISDDPTHDASSGTNRASPSPMHIFTSLGCRRLCSTVKPPAASSGPLRR